jgi:hypothetical protein
VLVFLQKIVDMSGKGKLERVLKCWFVHFSLFNFHHCFHSIVSLGSLRRFQLPSPEPGRVWARHASDSLPGSTSVLRTVWW